MAMDLSRWENMTIRGFKFSFASGEIFTPRGYCHDPSAGIIYISKPPVATLNMSVIPQVANADITWNVSDSVQPTGTIDEFTLRFGGTTDTGDIVAADWQTAPLTNQVQYTAAGRFAATLTVTDTLGEVSAPARVTVDIVEFDGTVYIFTSDAGAFKQIGSATMAAINTGLSGGDLNMLCGAVNPFYKHLPNSLHHLWASTDNGLVRSTNGGGAWTTIPKATLGDPTNSAGDGSPPTIGDLDLTGDFVFWTRRLVSVFARTKSAFGGTARSYVYHSFDYGTTWQSEGLHT